MLTACVRLLHLRRLNFELSLNPQLKMNSSPCQMESFQIPCVLWCLHTKSDLSEPYKHLKLGKVTVVHLKLAKNKNTGHNLDITMHNK